MRKRRRKTPQYYYNIQKQSAKARGIGWNFTFETWWAVWEASGKWEKRGCRAGQYVMGRHGDSGIYEPDNVSIIEASQNNSAGMTGWPARKQAREKAKAKETATAPTVVVTELVNDGRRIQIQLDAFERR